MKNYQRQIVKIVGEISVEKGYSMQEICDGFCLLVSNGNQETKIFGYQFANDAVSATIATDKSACFELLASKNIPAVPHFLILPEEKSQFVNSPLQACDLLEKYGEMVAKPCRGTSGEHIFRIANIAEFESAKNEILPYSRDIVLSPFFNLEGECRCVCLCGKVLLIYEKIRKDDWKHNLACGGFANVLQVEKNPQLESLALKTASAVGLDFCAVDIVQCGGKNYVLEVNSGIMFERFSKFSKENYKIAKGIYALGLEYFLKEEL